MCRSCGHFVTATLDDDAVVPIAAECPECGGAEFKDNENEALVRTD